MRGAAHRAADMIYEKLTGIKGVFGTKVAYVHGQAAGGSSVCIRSSCPIRTVKTSIRSWRATIRSCRRRGLRTVASWRTSHSKATSPRFFVQTLRTGNRFQVSSKPGINGAPAFSPDGRKLVVTLGGHRRQSRHIRARHYVAADAAPDDTSRNRYRRHLVTGWAPYLFHFGPQVAAHRCTVCPQNGGTPERITFEGSYNARPRLSPDGTRLAMVHNDRGNYRIAVMNLDRKDLLVLSTGRQDESPSFAPNSDILIYATRQARNGVLETVSADGLIRQKMASGQGDVREPVWSPFPRF